MRVDKSERLAGALAPERLAALVATFDERGLFVLENVVDPESDALVALGEKMKRDGRSIVDAGGWASRGDFGHGHLQLGAPRSAPWVLPEIVANPIIEQCVCAILRSPAKLGFYNGNCAMPGCGTQRLHMDGPHLYDSKEAATAAGEQWPHLSNDVHVNINPAGAATKHNGATEVWPGSHRVYTHKPAGFTSSTVGSAEQAASTGSLQDEAFVEARRQAEPPVRNEFPPGACAFRDARVWVRTIMAILLLSPRIYELRGFDFLWLCWRARAASWSPKRIERTTTEHGADLP